MKTIWKYEFAVLDLFALDMPIGAEILCVKPQQDKTCLWALVENSAEKEKRIFYIHGTGHTITQPENKKYIDSFFPPGSQFVWHLFELKNTDA